MASDGTGIANVELSIREQSSSKYWNGSSFSSTTPILLTGSVTSWVYSLPRPADGFYTVSVRATDTATPSANTSKPKSVTFQVDTSPPAEPTFTNTPEDPTFETNAQFNYRHAEAGVTFECALDDATLAACGPQGIEYKNLSPGTHTFTVVAIDAAGNRSSPVTTWSWAVLENKKFGISGNLSGQLYPGVSVPLDLKLSNPYNFSIRVTGITVVATDTTNEGCLLDDVSTIGLTTPTVDVPANQSVQLTDSYSFDEWPTTWPRVGLDNTDQRQDDCKDATFTITYTGTATRS